MGWQLIQHCDPAVTSLRRAKRSKPSGKPLHISDLLVALGKETDHDNRAALSGSLSAYVRKHEIFTRPAPNTFGLVEFETNLQRRGNGAAGPPPRFWNR